MLIRKIEKKEYKNKARINNFFAGVIIELTSVCNFKCIHCYNDVAYKYIGQQNIDIIIKRLNELGVVFVTLTGGEVKMHPYFEEIYIKLRKEGFLVSLYTNASRLHLYIETIIKYKPYMISLSLYGLSEENYDFFTGTKVFDQVKSNICLFNKTVNIEIKVLVNKYNINLVMSGQYQKFIDEFGVSNVFYDPFLFITKNGNINPIKYRISPKEAAWILNKYNRISCEIIREKSPIDFYCENGNTYFNIDVDSNCSICMKDKKKINITKNKDDIYLFLRKRANEIKIKAQTLRCANCKCNLACGWCPIEFEYDLERNEEESYICKVRHEFMKLQR